MLDFQTAKNLIMSKEKILLLTHQKMDIDWLSSILTLWTFLENLWKEVKIISTDEIPDSFDFLPFIKKVRISKNATKDFVISLKLNWASVDKLKYNTEWDKLNIVINSKNWEITQEWISFAKWIWKFDLIICADTASLENLWDLYFENTNLFFETPIINIDHHATNEEFWQINLLDITAASSTMIVFDLIKNFSEDWKEIIDEDVATLLMAWLITDTWSFQHNNTSPKALECAADLMDLWARQQEIIKNVYKTKQLSMLKIWWKILTNIKEDPISRVVWSLVDKDDFIETWAGIDETEWLIDELMSNAPWSEVIILAKESRDNKIFVSLRSNSIAVDVSEIAKENWWWWHKNAAWFVIEDYKNFNSEMWKFIEKIQNSQKERLWISDEDVEKLKNKKSEISENEVKKDFSSVNVKLDLPEQKKEEVKKVEIKEEKKEEKKVEHKKVEEKNLEKKDFPKKIEKKPEVKKELPKKPEFKKPEQPKIKPEQKPKIEKNSEEIEKKKQEENKKKQIEENKKRQEEERKRKELEAKKLEEEIKKEKEEAEKKAQEEKAEQERKQKEVEEKAKQEEIKKAEAEKKAEEVKPTEEKPKNESVISPQEADKHARNFYDLLTKTPQDNPSYKKYYDSYMYYWKLAWWPGM